MTTTRHKKRVVGPKKGQYRVVRAGKPTENKLFPGLPHYTGPDTGWFAWVHHGKLFEHTDVDGDSIKARVAYVRANKPKDERRIRLHHIMYLGKSLNAKLTKIAATEHCAKGYLHQRPDARKLVYAYIKRHKPKNQWNATLRYDGSLMKANGEIMTG